jgi:hypothetical protein
MARDLVPLTEAHQRWPWCTPRYGRRLVAERKVAFHKIGRRVYFDAADLDDFAERGRVEPPRRLRAIR